MWEGHEGNTGTAERVKGIVDWRLVDWRKRRDRGWRSEDRRRKTEDGGQGGQNEWMSANHLMIEMELDDWGKGWMSTNHRINESSN